MPRQSIDDQIAAKIHEFVSELTTLVREAAIESVSDALGTGTAPRRAKSSNGRRKARKATSTRKPRGRVRRSSADLEGMMDKVLAHVQAHDGDRLEHISKALKIASKELKRPVSMLMDEGKLKTTGQKRGTMYHVGSGSPRKAKKAVGKKRKATSKKRAKRKTSKKAA